jgi:hypothetical protein
MGPLSNKHASQLPLMLRLGPSLLSRQREGMAHSFQHKICAAPLAGAKQRVFGPTPGLDQTANGNEPVRPAQAIDNAGLLYD